MRWTRLVMALVAVSVALAGCSDGEPEGSPAPEASTEETTGAAAAAAGQGSLPGASAPLRPAPAVPDPTVLGVLEWDRIEYELEPRIVDGSAQVSPYIVVPEGSVHAPKEAGPFPVVVLMHGRHGTCDLAGMAERLGNPCPEAPPVIQPVDSFTGYDYLAENLASHGYVVASLSANHVNDRDNDFSQVGDDAGATARARLLLSFLDDLRAVQAGEGPEPLRPLAGKLDLSRIGVMGHSRGGEGVARAATLNAEWPEPHALAAVFALAPTDFDRHLVLDVPLAVLLPYCDGDVSNLQGAWMYDDAVGEGATAPLHQYLAMGANHNWYNTVWEGSDWGNRGDLHCDLDDDKSGRDSASAQRSHGLAIMGSFTRLYVGGEAAFRPLVVGEVPFDQSGIVVTYQPPPTQRKDVPLGTAEGFADRDDCTGSQCPIERTFSTARQTYFAWDGPATLSHPIAVTDASTFERVALRIGFDHETDGAGDSPVLVTLEDAAGRVATVPLRGGIFHPPGEDGAKTTLNMAWAPLSEFGAVDLSRLVWLRVNFTGEGAAQLTDLQLQDLR